VSQQPAKPAAPVTIEKEFPDGPCLEGKVYVMDTPYEQRFVIMSEETWGMHGTRVETMRRLLQAQDTKIKTMVAENAARDRVNADLLTRLDALRAIRRAEKRVDVEADMNLPTGN
jgi:hypothetical protein